MLVALREYSPQNIRAGTIQPLLLGLLIVFILLFAVAVNQTRLWTVRAELQNNADATGLDAALFLVQDDFLRASLGNDPSPLPPLLTRARQEAIDFATKNPVNARVFELRDNPLNLPAGDMVFGILDTPRSRQLVLPGDVADTSNAQLLAINTILINERLTQKRGNAPGLLFPQFTGRRFQDIVARAAVILDRDVVGFQPTVDQALPLAPLAFRADYTLKDKLSWNYQIEVKADWVDQYEFVSTTQTFDTTKGDGLPEFEAILTFDKTTIATANGAFVFVGITAGDFAALNEQLLAGLSKTDLRSFGQPYLLAPGTNALAVPGSATGSSVVAEQNQLQENLQMLQTQAAVRIWPLYSAVDGTGNVTLSGFVAGRVANVEAISGNQLKFVVQPTVLAINAAVTNTAQRGQNGVPITNPYICKLHLVE